MAVRLAQPKHTADFAAEQQPGSNLPDLLRRAYTGCIRSRQGYPAFRNP